MRIVLAGNPNVGKSSIFSRLTGVGAVCSNYPGTTVTYSCGKLVHDGISAELFDLPGTYSLNAESPAEKVASDMLGSGDLIINVVDATNLERNLYLTLQVLELGRPTVVALNMADDARHLGVGIDRGRLEELLGVPVVETVAVTGEGIKELVDRFKDAGVVAIKRSDEEKWVEIGEIIGKVQTLKDKRHSLSETLEDATIKPWTGIPIALLILYATFTIIISLGNFLTDRVLDPLFKALWKPAVSAVVNPFFPEGVVHDILLGRGEDMITGLGVLTTGVYVPLAMIAPFVALFYFMLSILEDTGYLPRLATLMDNLMHRIGLHGSAIVPTVLGLGCRVPGILATRMLETKKQRFISATLLSICVPCLAQNAVIIGLLAKHGIEYILIVYGTLLVLFISTGLVLNRFVGGESPEILLEIPPYRRPQLRSLLSKTWLRLRYFLTEAVPYIVLGVFAVDVLSAYGVIEAFSGIFGPSMSRLFGLPEEAVVALILGFLRKDFAVGMLAPIAMTPMQLTVASTLLVVFFPCMATLTVLYNELGLRDFLKAMALMFVVTLLTGVAMNAVFL